MAENIKMALQYNLHSEATFDHYARTQCHLL